MNENRQVRVRAPRFKKIHSTIPTLLTILPYLVIQCLTVRVHVVRQLQIAPQRGHANDFRPPVCPSFTLPAPRRCTNAGQMMKYMHVYGIHKHVYMVYEDFKFRKQQ